MRILVTGSRDWEDKNTIYAALENARQAEGASHDSVLLIHGDCPTGADRIAANFAEAMDWGVKPFPADWDRYGKRAGFMRNVQMVDNLVSFRHIEPVTCLAFPMPCRKPDCPQVGQHDSHGTAHCAGYAEAMGLPVGIFRP